MKIPKMNKEMLIYVDSTPDDGYPLRILKAHRENCNCRYMAEPPSALWDEMNKFQEQRAEILDRAIETLEKDK